MIIRCLRHLNLFCALGLATSLYAQDLTVAEINLKTLASVHPVDTRLPNGTYGVPPMFTFSADGNTIYSAGGMQATAVSRKTGELLHTYALQNMALWAAVTPDQSLLIVATCNESFGACAQNYLEIFDVSSEQSVSVISFGMELISDVKVAPGGKAFYVTHHYYYFCPGCFAPSPGSIQSNAVTAFSVSTLEPIANFAPPNGMSYPPLNMVITRDGGTGYIAAGSVLYKVGLPSLSVATNISLPISPAPMELSTTGKLLVLGQAYPPDIVFLNTETLAITGPVNLGDTVLRNVAFSFDGSTALASATVQDDGVEGNLYTISVASATVTATGNYDTAGLVEGSPTGGVFVMFGGISPP